MSKLQSEETNQRAIIKSSEMDSHVKYEIGQIPNAEKIMLCFQREAYH
ncbi:MAG: hypothetical protein OEY88_08705 [Candidatus Bathyarchaeota archaeon]|nr:hypothetical protein [Candidatus Bathyarchaeota archaeon]